MKRKFVFLVADGMGGWPLEELGGKTVMEAADTPRMDFMARSGLCGLARTVPRGMPPGSDVANMSLLGFNPARFHTGRGPIEAAAQGLVLGPEDVVWRCNLARVSALDPSGVMLDYSSGHISTAQAAPLVERLSAMAAGSAFEFHLGVQYRHLLVMRGGAGSPDAASALRPPHDITGQSIAPDLEALEACPALKPLVYDAQALLADAQNATPANTIWPWGQGRALTLPDFVGERGLRGAVVSAVDLIRGLGRAAGMAAPEVEGVTGLLDTNYEGKVQAALDFLRDGDFVFVHVEAPDECGHAGNVADKLEAVRRFDERVVAPLLRALPDAVFLVTCDHLTPIARKTHVDDPVPFVLWAEGLGSNGATAFSESQAGATGLVLERGHDLLSWALEKTQGAL
ncbi:cofactor-independent phosphoglycerate mutase [Fundidesulfovibrio butyratiphilus]